VGIGEKLQGDGMRWEENIKDGRRML